MKDGDDCCFCTQPELLAWCMTKFGITWRSTTCWKSNTFDGSQILPYWCDVYPQDSDSVKLYDHHSSLPNICADERIHGTKLTIKKRSRRKPQISLIMIMTSQESAKGCWISRVSSSVSATCTIKHTWMSEVRGLEEVSHTLRARVCKQRSL